MFPWKFVLVLYIQITDQNFITGLEGNWPEPVKEVAREVGWLVFHVTEYKGVLVI